jgi:hypothetical protein
MVFQRIREQLDRTIKTPRNETEIDVWLESPGGNAHVAYKLFLELRFRAQKIRVVIPDYAKSAATLLAIGADEIWMSCSAELGPLDAQIGHPDREGVTVSALDVSNALGFLAETALSYLIVGGGKVVKSTELPRVNVLERFAEFSSMFFRPVVEKLDPHLVHQATKELEVAQRYAKDMLCTREHGKCDCDKLATALVKEYPSHGFVISRHAAESLGLPVFEAEVYNYWPLATTLFTLYEHGKFTHKESNGRIINHLIEVSSFTDLVDSINRRLNRDTKGASKHDNHRNDKPNDPIKSSPEDASQSSSVQESAT